MNTSNIKNCIYFTAIHQDTSFLGDFSVFHVSDVLVELASFVYNVIIYL